MNLPIPFHSGTTGGAPKSISPTALGWIVHICLVAILYAGAFYLYLRQPLWYRAMIVEDNLGEYLTVTLYIGAATLLTLHVVSRGGRCLGHCLLIACFVFMAGEEISWGQRIFDIATPASWAAINYQHELSLHNVVRINTYLPLLAAAVVLWAALTPWLPRYAWYRWLDAKVGIPAAKSYHFPSFLMAAHFLDSKPFFQGAELGEVLLALAFFLYAASYRPGMQRYPFAVASMIFVVAVAGASALTSSYPHDAIYRTHRLAAFYAENGLCSQAATVYEQLRHPSRPVSSVLYSPHHANIQYARILRHVGDDAGARRVMEQWLEHLQTTPEQRQGDPVRLEQLGDVYLHLRAMQSAAESYSNAHAMHRTRIDDADATAMTKYWAYIGVINIAAKLGDMQRADAAYAEVLQLDLDGAHLKRLKHRLLDYRAVKEHGTYSLTLRPKRRNSWGSFGSKPVGNCDFKDRLM